MPKTLPLVRELACRSFTELPSIVPPRKFSLMPIFAIAALALVAVLALGSSPAEAQCDPFDWSCWFTTDPPGASVNFFTSPQPFVCEFDRRDRPEGVNVLVGGPDINQPTDLAAQTFVHLYGLAACGPAPVPPATSLQQFGFFNVDITVGAAVIPPVPPATLPTFSGTCVKRTPTANGFLYQASFDGTCPVTQLVSGSLTRNTNFAVVGDGTWLSECEPIPFGQPGFAPCIIKVGIDNIISQSQFKTQVCQKDRSTGLAAGQVFAFSEHFVGNLLRPGTVQACYCNSHLEDLSHVVQCVANQPQKVVTPGASQCVFEYQKTGSNSQVINASGAPSNINAAIVDSPLCPVADIATKTVRVCDDVTPIQKSFKIQTNGGQTFLSFQFDEGACRDSLAQPLVVGTDVIIYVKGSFSSDGSPFEGGAANILVQ